MRRAGGEPRVLDSARRSAGRRRPPGRRHAAAPAAATCNPSLYGRRRIPTFDAAEAGPRRLRDRAGSRALEADLPLLGDLPRHPGAERRARRHAGAGHSRARSPAAIEHSIAVRRAARRHRARSLDRRTAALLARLLRASVDDGDDCAVNSRHHQAVKDARRRPGRRPPPRPTASSKRSRIRARRFCLGVQWHPENFYRTGEFRPLFEGFVEACSSTTSAASLSKVRLRRPDAERTGSKPAPDHAPLRAKTATLSTCAVFGNRSNPVNRPARTRVEQRARVARERRDVARHVDDPRRTPADEPASASFDMPVRGGSTMNVVGRCDRRARPLAETVSTLRRSTRARRAKRLGVGLRGRRR